MAVTLCKKKIRYPAWQRDFLNLIGDPAGEIGRMGVGETNIGATMFDCAILEGLRPNRCYEVVGGCGATCAKIFECTNRR